MCSFRHHASRIIRHPSHLPPRSQTSDTTSHQSALSPHCTCIGSASPELRLTILHHLTLHYTFPHRGTQRHHIQNHCMPQIYPLAIHPMPCINPGHRASSHTTPHRPKPPALRHIIPHQFTLLYTVPHRTLLFYAILFFHPLIFIFIMLSLLHSLSPSLFHALIPILSSRVILHHLLLPALVLIPLVLSFPFIHQVSFWVIVLPNRSHPVGFRSPLCPVITLGLVNRKLVLCVAC